MKLERRVEALTVSVMLLFISTQAAADFNACATDFNTCATNPDSNPFPALP